jgi:glycosyltransferase involved in cell wall biosynthesis
MASVNQRPEEVRNVSVAFLGQPPHDGLPTGFEQVSPEAGADVYHVRHDGLDALRDLRTRNGNAGVVVDLTAISVRQLDRRVLALARDADIIAVASADEAAVLEQHEPALAGRTSVVPTSINLRTFAPDAELAATRRVHYARFKRYHRLAPPTVMFAGPYTPSGGLALAIDAVYRLRETLEDIRLTAIPFGRVDMRYLDQCERRALLLGHRGIVEWTAPTEDDLPFWFATASVVLIAEDEAARPALLAGAAARPVVALDDAAAENRHATSVVTRDSDALAEAIRELLGPTGVAAGEESRREIVAQELATGLRLGQLWRSAASDAGFNNAPLRTARADATSAPSSSTVIQPR